MGGIIETGDRGGWHRRSRRSGQRHGAISQASLKSRSDPPTPLRFGCLPAIHFVALPHNALSRLVFPDRTAVSPPLSLQPEPTCRPSEPQHIARLYFASHKWLNSPSACSTFCFFLPTLKTWPFGLRPIRCSPPSHLPTFYFFPFLHPPSNVNKPCLTRMALT